MARITIDGIGIEYELLGEAGAPTIVVTLGGRFSKEEPGMHELADKLVAGGRRVLLWDRPNCGSSDISFDAESESGMHADVLIKLIRALELGKVTLAAGSAGSRVSLIAAVRGPDVVSHMVLWNISGGNIGLMSLGVFYSQESAAAAARGGMEEVTRASAWAEQIQKNPRNRDIILAQDPQVFIETMQRWALFFAPAPDSPVPGVTPADFASLKMPVLILRNGHSDMAHSRRTTEWVHELIPGSVIKDPPWPDNEWNLRSKTRSEPGRGLFDNWPALAPDILSFTA